MLEAGQVVLSLSGHDKDSFYVVVKLGDGCCWIADGKRRSLLRPKKKNPRHLRATAKRVQLSDALTDRALRRTLAQLCQEAPDPSSTREESCACQNKTSSR